MVPIIFTDASCDLPRNFIDENNIPFLGLMCNFKGKDWEDDFGKTLSYEEFYTGIKKGEMPSTSQINEYRFEEKFKELLKEERPIIYIAMSSGLSGTVNSAKMAREEILAQNEKADITIIDTKCSSIGQGLLVYNAVQMAKEGKSKEEIVKWINENKDKVNHWFMVENLTHLKRGGRVSATSATIGTLLNIRPIIHIEKDGTLKNITNIRGSKKAIRYLLDRFKENCINHEDVLIGIVHGHCAEEAEKLKEMVIEEFGTKNFIINELGIGMGAHCGDGMLALCFIANNI
ncbi:DegV family protein [Clostridium botulinum]|uniref:DegV family protein n=1 Tax=Clostridium botulinum B str. Osaka05 TaxID=1407017 RepID=A0A0S6U3T5_CLOBO|nr:DegV family protein [Clostridium botulinum]EKO1912431.1 DegV family protein [Clostridium botulinum]EKO2042492.1 DegV family protein [Clostridium botulinum]GAE03011.1 DegV family protein [Clostridium botulinum B str. Osaka05]HDK7167225.1 DegV family protein [Clostridium botulinum]HDK7174707.1 DegV family protein [Clostridium botulinum]